MMSSHNHKHEHLTGEKPSSHTNQMILAVVFFVVWIVDSFLLRLTTYLFNMTSIWICIPLGLIVILLSIYFMNVSHRDIFDTKTNGVVSHGVYGRVRHPMYLGTFLLYLGLGIITLSLASLIVWVIAVGYYNSLANYEEHLLEEKFGTDYSEYKKNVRKWIPL